MAEKKTKKTGAKVLNKQAILFGPRITEKAALTSGGNVYTFNVSTKATKTEIKKAIKDLYGVLPVKVNTTKVPNKKVRRGAILGVKTGGKKAMVYLKKGDSIELV